MKVYDGDWNIWFDNVFKKIILKLFVLRLMLYVYV